MSLSTIISEYWRFIKENRFRLLIGIFVGVIVVLGSRFALSQLWLDGRSSDYQTLAKVYQQEPAEFQAVISIEDGQLFTSSYIYDEYFSSPEVVAQIEKETGVKFAANVAAERRLELYKTGAFRGGIATVRDGASGIVTFRFLIATSSKDNLKIAQAYAKLLTSGQMKFNQNQRLEITRQPEIIELLNLEEVEMVPTPATLGMFAGMTPKVIVVFSVLGAIVGLVVTFVILWLLRLCQPKIAYSFEYAWDFDDRHLIVVKARTQQEDSLVSLIRIPHLAHRFIVGQKTSEILPADKLGQNEGDYYFNQLQEASPLAELPQEIVLLIDANATDKAWYKEQYALAKMYRVPLKIIQLI